MNKIAQYENNMIYIIKKQEDFCQNKVNSSLVSSCTYKTSGFKSCPNSYTVRESLGLLWKRKKSPKWHQTKAPVRWMPFSLLHGATKKAHGERGRLLVPMRNTHAGLGCHQTLNHGAIHRINHYSADKYKGKQLHYIFDRDLSTF